MAKLRKGATVVLKLDELYLWIRKKQNQQNTDNNDPNSATKARFKIVNRALDFNKLPPCRAKIIYMGIPKFLKQKKLIFGVQLYPPYFGLSQRIYKSTNTRKILGKIQIKEFKAPKGSIWFITENDIKGVMLRNNPRRMSKGATQMTDHLGSPNISKSNIAQNMKHLNMRSSSKSPRNENKEKEDLWQEENGSNSPKHFRRKSSFSMSCHYKNLSSLDAISDVESLFWEDIHLPSDYTIGGKRKKLTNSGIVRSMEQDPKQRRFKLDRWLYPIFLDFDDSQTTEIVCDRCQWELTQWIRDESEGVRTPTLRQFYDYMVSLSDNVDAIFINYTQDSLDKVSFMFEMMTRIKELTESVEDALEAHFVLNVIDALDNDVFVASPILQYILKYIGNDVKFMCILKEHCKDPMKCTKILQSMDRYNEKHSILPLVWRLVETINNEILIGKVLIQTDNLAETDPEALTLGIINALDHNLNMIIPTFECISDRIFNHDNGYILNHIKEILRLSQHEMNIDIVNMVKFGIGHHLVSPSQLFKLWKQHNDKPIIEQLNILSSMQCKYEQYQLFLGRYLLYCPFKTKAVHSVEYKQKEQDEVVFYDDEDIEDDDDTTALLIELTIDIDNVNGTANKQLMIKKTLCVKNYKSLEYEPDHYYNDELVFSWDLINYNDKMLRLNHTRCQWIPNLKNVSKINPSFSSIDENPEDLSNEYRGYLVLLPDNDGKYDFIDDLFRKWSSKHNNKYREALHKMQERPLFVSMEKWKLTDNY